MVKKSEVSEQKCTEGKDFIDYAVLCNV